MADSKITALTALTAADPANDMIPIVDVSDTPPASGNTKRISINNLLACSPSATLASATITGDLTVNTNVLKVDTTNDRVGIGTASPSVPLEIRASDNSVLTTGGSANFTQFKAQIDSGAGTSIGSYQNVFGYVGTSSNHYLEIRANNIAQQKIEPLGIFSWYDGAGGTRMTLNSNGLLVGTTNNFASSRLCVQGTAGTTTPDVTIGIPVNSSGNTGLAIGRSASTNGYIFLDAYKAAVGGTELVLNSINGGSVLIGLSTVVAAGGCLQLKSGITFPATQVASSDANTLDDYEEGTFTPVIIGTSTAGTGTYTTQQGRYTKIGNQVTVHIFLDWSAHTGTGNLKLAGLPFQSSNNFHACSIGFWNNIAVTAANVPMAYVINSETNISLIQMPSGGGAMVAIPMDTAGAFILSATYTV